MPLLTSGFLEMCSLISSLASVSTYNSTGIPLIVGSYLLFQVDLYRLYTTGYRSFGSFNDFVSATMCKSMSES